jgi:hypothetical protein
MDDENLRMKGKLFKYDIHVNKISMFIINYGYLFIKNYEIMTQLHLVEAKNERRRDRERDVRSG